MFLASPARLPFEIVTKRPIRRLRQYPAVPYAESFAGSLAIVRD